MASRFVPLGFLVAITASLASASSTPALRAGGSTLVNAPGKSSYPISAVTWAVVYANQPDGKGPAIADFLRWVIHDGQQFSEPLHYAPRPPALVERTEHKISELAASK
jgi:ABC-type phosphate transport system substrate-binding protein